jgi:hypothetical protein
MNYKRLLTGAAVSTTAVLLTPLRLSHALAPGGTVAIAGNHPNIALTGWKPALRNRRELAELKTQLQQPGSPNYHKWLSTAEFIRRFGPTSDAPADGRCD